jgi:hypothetical protein
MKSLRAMQETFEYLVEIELAIGALYARYAERFPAMQEVWRQLQREEARHAGWLRSLQVEIGGTTDDVIVFKPERFTPQVLEAYLSIVRAALNDAEQDTPAQALQRAIAIEHSFIETQFYEVVAGSHPVIANVFRALAAETVAHQARLEEIAAAMEGE